MEGLIIFGYIFSVSVICLFAMVQLYVIIQYNRSKTKGATVLPLTKFPKVTIQLPVYNEKYVVARLIDAVGNIQYPKDQLEVQVLDDSDDETCSIIENSVVKWKEKGLNIHQIRRPSREGFKAGALQYGLEQASGEFIAIFDADFIPNEDFLYRTLPHFEENTGMVQTRWGHINKNYNLLTRIQAFALDAHFTIEQSGRLHSGRLINFNGTAGIWRKQCIVDAGGWKANTLTEDLDLSYRAQLKGWKFNYLEDTVSPGELPTIVPSIKSQQYRWNKGAAETARQSIPNILKSKLSLGTKIHGIAHLMNSSVFLWLFIAAITSVPLILIKQSTNDHWIWSWGGVFVFGFIIITLFYWTALRSIDKKASWKHFIKDFPAFIVLTSGLSLHNSIAVSEGYLGIKSPFIRTPKFNLKKKKESIKDDAYLKVSVSPIVFLEGLLSVYFISGILIGIYFREFGFLPWHLLLAIGFGFVFYKSLMPFTK